MPTMFDLVAVDGDDLREMPLLERKARLSKLLDRRPEGIFVAPFERGEIGPDPFRASCRMKVRGFGVQASASDIGLGPVTGSRSRTGSIRRFRG